MSDKKTKQTKKTLKSEEGATPTPDKKVDGKGFEDKAPPKIINWDAQINQSKGEHEIAKRLHTSLIAKIKEVEGDIIRIQGQIDMLSEFKAKGFQIVQTSEVSEELLNSVKPPKKSQKKEGK